MYGATPGRRQHSAERRHLRPRPDQLHCAYSSASWDIRHSFTTASITNCPSAAAVIRQQYEPCRRRVVGGWQFNGIMTFRTGVRSPCRYQLPRRAGASACRITPTASPATATLHLRAAARPPSGSTSRLCGGLFQSGGRDCHRRRRRSGPDDRSADQTLDFSLFKPSGSRTIPCPVPRGALNLANTPVFGHPDASLGDSKLTAAMATSARLRVR